jgi:outer membrane protein OmpA-like peptidoglycan-associated protein
MRGIVGVVVACVVLSGCQTTDPYTGEQQVNKKTKYGGIGAVSGAIVGGLIDGKDGAWKGAVAGGAAGVGYGHYVDKQEAAMRERLRGTGVSVKRHGDQLTLVMPGNITFETNASDVKPEFYPVLSSVSDVIKEFDQSLLMVTGHTDSTGSDKYNQVLSEKRAQSVASFLVNQGVQPARITSWGVGSSKPIASNASSEGRAMNRRVEIDLLAPPGES